MKVLGREIGFLRTVEANFKLDEISPGGDLNRFGELFDNATVSQVYKTEMKTIQILNEAYEKRQKFLDPSYEIKVITDEELQVLTPEEFQELSDAAIRALEGKQTVDIESDAKKKVNP